ncbi:MAG TPA: ABC transporter substrate-binding protein [Rhizobacter sp.]|nr:ABC transporter substrate-binding protein [Rhizobacter sp.]
MNRRKLLKASTAWWAGSGVLCFPALSMAQPSVIKFGQSAAMTGPAAIEGKQIREGIVAAFESASKAEGGKGPRFELVTLDDANVPERCSENVKTLLASDVSALIGLTSGEGAEASMHLIEQSQIALLGTASGSMGLRSDGTPAYHVRAGYDVEFKRMVSYVKELGLQRVGIVHLEGTSSPNLAAMTMALGSVGLVAVETVAIHPRAASFNGVADKLLAARLDCVLFMANAEPIVSILNQMRRNDFRGPVFASSMAGQTLMDTLVAQHQSAILSMVVPRPTALGLGVVTRCQQDLAWLGTGAKVSMATLEGYISGRIAVEAARNTLQGGAMSKARLKDSLSRLRADLGGYKVQFAPGSHQGSKYVELVSIDRFGRIIG